LDFADVMLQWKHKAYALTYADFSKREARDLVSIFHRLDRNHDGAIDTKELTSVDHDVVRSAKFMTLVDVNKDSKIDFDEWMKFFHGVKVGHSAEELDILITLWIRKTGNHSTSR